MWSILSLYSTGLQDSLEISTKNGEPLMFPTFEVCSDYVDQNLDPLIEFSQKHYPPEYGPRVVFCIQMEEGLTL